MSSDIEIRDRILSYAQDKFMTEGFSKVTLDEIAAELGISKKTVYKHFDSKEELLRSCMRMRLHGVADEIERIVNSPRSFKEKLTEVLMVVGRQVSKVNKKAQLDMQKVSPSIWKEVETFRREMIFHKMGKMISQARDENIFRSEVDEQVLLLMVLNCVQDIVNPEVLSQNSFSAEDAFRTIFRIIFEGALTDEARLNFHLFEVPTTTF
jgi:AcrR family transcriptional regulator